MDAKISKLEEQFADNAARNPYKESDLFAGMSIFVNGLTNPSSDELKRIMMVHGGIYHTYQRSTTKFIIASNLPDVKIRQLTTAKIVSPQWIVDCLKVKRILDYSKYLLYTNSKVSQPKIRFGGAKKQETLNESHSSTEVVHQNVIEKKIDLNSSISVGLNALNNMLMEDADSSLLKQPSRQDTTFAREKNVTTNTSVARTANDPNFLSEFYNNSRLHHIATLGAGFKHYVSQLRESHEGAFPARANLKEILFQKTSGLLSLRKTVMHIDMDCFFVSVGLRSRPHLRGQPIAVTHSKGTNANQVKQRAGADRQKEMALYAKRHDDRFKQHGIEPSDEDSRPEIDNTTSLSEIASCSYEARKMGVKNGMFVGAALKLCPKLKTIPYDFEGYKEVAYTLYNTIVQ